MGELYEARERATGERLAVKVLRSGRSSETARFEREAAILATSSHPRIVRFVARGALPSGEPWLVMEWLEGEDLASRLRRGPLDVAEGIRLLQTAAEALGALHARGIVHRDIKPSNLFLEGGQIDRLKLLDFGIARVEGAPRLTDEGLLVGTPGYMAPEQARSDESIDPRADVFSLGAVVFECITGEKAFPGAHFLGILTKLLYEETPRLRTRVPHVPEGLEELVARMLAKALEDRPADGRALALALSPAWISGDVGPKASPREKTEPRGALTESERRVLVRTERADGPRLLLGKATPCVGRERELGMVQEIFDACEDEGLAHAVLVVAPPGMGKSRFAHELSRILQARGTPMSIWRARADRLRQTSAYCLLGQALRSVFDIREGQPAEAQREALLARVEPRFSGPSGRRVAELLGEIVGARFSDAESPPLREARKSAQLLADRIQDAWLSFLKAECSEAPVLLVLDDLQWSDKPSLQLVDAALRECHEGRLLVLGLARPEVHDASPKLWSSRRMYELKLRKLGAKAGEELVRHVLGDAASEETTTRLSALSDGNAFYLEELIRATAEDERSALPLTVVAMVQSRLGQQGPLSRRFLRAASIFGETFWTGGVAALLGPGPSASEIREVLTQLTDGEFVAKVRASRFPGEEEVRFRHALLREGAYSMLTDADRALGHRLAGEWLEERGEADPSVLAEHFERGGDAERACHFHERAAEHSFEHFDLDGVLSHAERGVACGATGEALLALRSWQLMAHYHRWNFTEEVLRLAGEMRALARPGSATWYRFTLVLCTHSMFTGRRDQISVFAREIVSTRPVREARTVAMELANIIVGGLAVAGEREISTEMLAYVERAEASFEETDLRERCHAWQTRAWHLLFMASEPRETFLLLSKAAAGFAEVGDLREQGSLQSAAVLTLLWMGQHERSKTLARETLTLAERTRDAVVIGQARGAVQWVLLLSGESRDLEELGPMARETLAQYPEPTVFSGFAHVCLSRVLLHEGDPGGAEVHAREAREILSTLLSFQWLASASLVAALLRQGRAADARAAAEQGAQKLEALGSHGLTESRFRLALVEARMAAGDVAAAREAVAEAKEVIVSTAERIADPAFRRSYLEDAPARRTLALAEALGLGRME